MCMSGPKPKDPPPPSSPPPPEPEMADDETGDQTKDRLKKDAEGTNSLRIDRTQITTGDASAGLQVQRAPGGKTKTKRAAT